MRAAGAIASLILVAVTGLVAPPAQAAAPPGKPPVKRPVAEGYGGGVATGDLAAGPAAPATLRRGGSPLARAAAGGGTLGVTGPHSAGTAGGGFLLHYDARPRQVTPIDGRETAPRAMPSTALEGIPFDEAVTSGLSVGVPGTVALWDAGLRKHGTLPLRAVLRPAIV